MITTSDIAAIYVKRELRKGNLTRDTPLPLCDIQTSSYVTREADTLSRLVGNIANLKPKDLESRKPDPIATMFNEIDGSKSVDARKFNSAIWSVKNRENYLPEIGQVLLTLADDVEISPLPQIDAVMVNECWQPIAVLKIAKNERNIAQAARDFESVLTSPDSPYHGCIPLYISRIPKDDGSEKPLISEDNPLSKQFGKLNIRSIGLQAFYSQYCNSDSLYIDALVITAQAMHREQKLEHNYDMREIFNLL
ncbi:hypothetical protein OCF84_21715 (plasmid) [Shewanella xiamenensis]|uniref:Uncharacterized protein n=1 Tax=Shewanella xiamenensis TaxID=332186 RepID=A0ABT6UEP7_9GAMM|nr:hypothetical protein [Shewanella xiamenensis]MDI5832503.1 hypothetical protein [Shewanella xiamenensis]WHF57878.1 hypothetical protein OCF84_21715 [Shewanella xiamenensis]